MGSFTDNFMNNEEVNEFSQKELVLFEIIDVSKGESKLFGSDTPQEAIIFKIKDERGTESYLYQPTCKADGTERKNLFWPMGWNEINEVPRVASTMFDLKEAIKEYLGDAQYEFRKKECGGLNKRFFEKSKFRANLSSGMSKKDDKPYYIVKLISQQKISYWDYLIQKGDYVDYKDIPEVVELFKLNNSKTVKDNTQKVENTLNVNDLPF
jgi:hypothetical protein